MEGSATSERNCSGANRGDVRQWPSTISFPETGCYRIRAEWDMGNSEVLHPFTAPQDTPGATPVSSMQDENSSRLRNV